MVDFEFKGIHVNATGELERFDYKDANNRGQTRFNRNMVVTVWFWDFVIVNDLYELAMVKSTLNYFMQAYWKRSSKAGSKIELATALFRDDDFHPQSLNMIARQKNGIQSLEISVAVNGILAGEVYLSAQEVIMLDIAIGKAINLLSPDYKIIKGSL